MEDLDEKMGNLCEKLVKCTRETAAEIVETHREEIGDELTEKIKNEILGDNI